MAKQIYYFCILFYVSILLVLIVGCFGGFEGLYAAAKSSPKVIEKFEVGPIKGTQKKVVKVKTHFEWQMQNPCPCDAEEVPCVKSFLDKNLPTEEPEDVQLFNEMNQNSEKNEGGSMVPAIIEESSVRIITVPFCRQRNTQQ